MTLFYTAIHVATFLKILSKYMLGVLQKMYMCHYSLVKLSLCK